MSAKFLQSTEAIFNDTAVETGEGGRQKRKWETPDTSFPTTLFPSPCSVQKKEWEKIIISLRETDRPLCERGLRQ